MGNNSSKWDEMAHLKAKTSKELEQLQKWWEARQGSSIARDQIAKIRLLIAERIGKPKR